MFKISPNYFKFLHRVKMGLMYLFLKCQSVLTIFEGVIEL